MQAILICKLYKTRQAGCGYAEPSPPNALGNGVNRRTPVGYIEAIVSSFASSLLETSRGD